MFNFLLYVGDVMIRKSKWCMCSSDGWIWDCVASYKDGHFWVDGLREDRIVLNTFFPRKDWSKLEVIHLNGNDRDNRLDNLDWEYERPDREYIGFVWKNPYEWTINDMIQYFKISKRAIKEVWRGKWRKDIEGMPSQFREIGKQRSLRTLDWEYKCWLRGFNSLEDMRIAIREDFVKYGKIRIVAKKYDIHKATVYGIVKGKQKSRI